MESAVREVIDRVRTARPEIDEKLDVQYGVGDAGGVTLHRIAPREMRGDSDHAP